MQHVDEYTNEQLAAGMGYSRASLEDEYNRVKAFTLSRALTGEDLSYWFQRERILADRLAA